jgi:hypothetical protein
MTIPDLTASERGEIERLFRAAEELADAIETVMAGCPHQARHLNLHRGRFHARRCAGILASVVGIDANAPAA